MKKNTTNYDYDGNDDIFDNNDNDVMDMNDGNNTSSNSSTDTDIEDTEEETMEDEKAIIDRTNKFIDNMDLKVNQKKFLLGKKLLSVFDAIQSRRELTPGEYQALKGVNADLWKEVAPYAQQVAKQMMMKYDKASDHSSDVFQDMYIKFTESISKYDPKRTTPTTFFKVYFREAVSTYLHSFSQNLKQNDANNLAKVNAAYRKANAQGKDVTFEYLLIETNLSPKVLKNTLQLASNSRYANIDDAIDLATKAPTPEDALLDSEKKYEIVSAITKELNKDDLEFFLAKVNLDGDKELTYNQLADKFDITIREAKARYSDIIARLSNNTTLQAYSKTHIEEIDGLSLHDSSTDEMEDMIFGAFSDTNTTTLEKSNKTNSDDKKIS